MALDKLLLNEYENMLLGNVNSISPQLFSASPHIAEQRAIELIRYISENFLKWTPEELAMRLGKDFIEKMRLGDMVQHIQFPAEVNLNEEPDFTYLAVKIYPDQVTYSFRENVIDIYRRILSNQWGPANQGDSKELRELKKELSIDPYYRKTKERGNSIYKFPKNYMAGSIGMMRACICLQYMITTFFSFHSIAEMYDFFADEEKAVAALKKYRLLSVYKDMFDSTLEFLHTVLPDNQKNELLYSYYKFCHIYNQQAEN